MALCVRVSSRSVPSGRDRESAHPRDHECRVLADLTPAHPSASPSAPGNDRNPVPDCGPCTVKADPERPFLAMEAAVREPVNSADSGCAVKALMPDARAALVARSHRPPRSARPSASMAIYFTPRRFERTRRRAGMAACISVATTSASTARTRSMKACAAGDSERSCRWMIA